VQQSWPTSASISRLPVFVCILGLTYIGGCAPDDPRPAVQLQVEDSVVGTAIDLGLTTFISLVDSARMRPDLLMPGPFTVFAPRDEAFAALRPDVLGALRRRDNRGALRDLLHYHTVEESLPPHAIVGEASFTTLQGEALTITATADGLTLTDAQGNTARVQSVTTDPENGVLYVIDRVLFHVPVADLVNLDLQGPVASFSTD
jgi:uncharacterized surface protein with fasciclin (FAS1) repeats